MSQNTARKMDLFGENENKVRLQPKTMDQSNTIVEQANTLQPIEPFDFEAKENVSNLIRSARDMIKVIKDHHAPIKQAQKTALDITREKERVALKPVEDALAKAQSLLNKVTNAELLITQKKEEESQRQAQEEADERRKEAEEKMASLLAESETKAEQAKILEAALDDDSTTHDEAAVIRRKLSILQAQIEEGNSAIDATRYETMQPAFIPKPSAQKEEPKKVEGVSKRGKVTVEVKNLKLLCAAIGRGEVPAAAVKPMQGKLNSYGKDGMELPGCIVNEEVQAIVR